MTHSAMPRDIVLVVDDSPDTLHMLTTALEDAGVTVLVALEGSNALKLIEEITPDVVLMDAVMPGMDGFETCRRLKRNKNMAHVPVIFMTGLSETAHIVAGLEAGGVDYVTKPIVPDELIARMRVHLANARLSHSARAALDASGRFLLAIRATGAVLWSTPQARDLLGTAFGAPEEEDPALPDALPAWLAGAHEQPLAVPMANAPDRRVLFTFVGQIGADEYLLRITEDQSSKDEETLKQRMNLTLREAEVLLWTARGKSNRDIGEILGLSPRTVNKHLEKIFAKLGVENRASAAALATRALTPS